MLSAFQLRELRQKLICDGVIAYPTEAVAGLGCDPWNERAVQKILDLKQRDPAKGLIVIAAHQDQLAPFILPPEPEIQTQLDQTWPGPVTWLMPVTEQCPAWLRGQFTTLAVRVSDHPLVQQLCESLGPLVSTSANPSGLPSARSMINARRYFGERVDAYVVGEMGGRRAPSQIRDAGTGNVLR